MNFALLFASGALIILTCFSGALSYLNWSDQHYRWLFMLMTLVLLIGTIICITALFTAQQLSI